MASRPLDPGQWGDVSLQFSVFVGSAAIDGSRDPSPRAGSQPRAINGGTTPMRGHGAQTNVTSFIC